MLPITKSSPRRSFNSQTFESHFLSQWSKLISKGGTNINIPSNIVNASSTLLCYTLILPPPMRPYFRSCRCGTCRWHVQKSRACGTCKWNAHVVRACGTCMWRVQKSLACGTCKWHAHVVRACGTGIGHVHVLFGKKFSKKASLNLPSY